MTKSSLASERLAVAGRQRRCLGTCERRLRRRRPPWTLRPNAGDGCVVKGGALRLSERRRSLQSLFRVSSARIGWIAALSLSLAAALLVLPIHPAAATAAAAAPSIPSPFFRQHPSHNEVAAAAPLDTRNDRERALLRGRRRGRGRGRRIRRLDHPLATSTFCAECASAEAGRAGSEEGAAAAEGGGQEGVETGPHDGDGGAGAGGSDEQPGSEGGGARGEDGDGSGSQQDSGGYGSGQGGGSGHGPYYDGNQGHGHGLGHGGATEGGGPGVGGAGGGSSDYGGPGAGLFGSGGSGESGRGGGGTHHPSSPYQSTTLSDGGTLSHLDDMVAPFFLLAAILLLLALLYTLLFLCVVRLGRLRVDEDEYPNGRVYFCGTDWCYVPLCWFYRLYAADGSTNGGGRTGYLKKEERKEALKEVLRDGGKVYKIDESGAFVDGGYQGNDGGTIDQGSAVAAASSAGPSAPPAAVAATLDGESASVQDEKEEEIVFSAGEREASGHVPESNVAPRTKAAPQAKPEPAFAKKDTSPHYPDTEVEEASPPLSTLPEQCRVQDDDAAYDSDADDSTAVGTDLAITPGPKVPLSSSSSTARAPKSSASSSSGEASSLQSAAGTVPGPGSHSSSSSVTPKKAPSHLRAGKEPAPMPGYDASPSSSASDEARKMPCTSPEASAAASVASAADLCDAGAPAAAVGDESDSSSAAASSAVGTDVTVVPSSRGLKAAPSPSASTSEDSAGGDLVDSTATAEAPRSPGEHRDLLEEEINQAPAAVAGDDLGEEEGERGQQAVDEVRSFVAGDGNVCSICLDGYEPGDEYVAVPTVCPHRFHHDCLLDWLARRNNTACPCCRRDLVLNDDVFDVARRQKKEKRDSRRKEEGGKCSRCRSRGTACLWRSRRRRRRVAELTEDGGRTWWQRRSGGEAAAPNEEEAEDEDDFDQEAMDAQNQEREAEMTGIDAEMFAIADGTWGAGATAPSSPRAHGGGAGREVSANA